MTRPIEAGVLPLFRLFAGFQVLLLVVSIAAEAARPDAILAGQRWPGLAFSILLFGYLWWPWLEERLGRFYLPLGLTAASLGPLLGWAKALRLRAAAGIAAESSVQGNWVLIPLLLVPLILVAWQYGLRAVIGFTLLTSAADLVLTLPLAQRGGPPLSTLLAVVVVRSLFLLPVGVAVARLADAQRRQREALARANARLERQAASLEQLAVSRERNRLARELHDTLAHGLSGVAVQLEAVTALWERQPEVARGMLTEALGTTRTGLREARRAIAALRASPLEDLGLSAAVRDLAESAAARAGLQLELEVADRIDGLAPEAEQALYRVAEEALANVTRHAQARHLAVSLERVGPTIRLAIRDDGRGFDSAAVDESHFGLRGLRERAQLLGGELEVESAPGAGTALRLAVRSGDDSRPDL